jgi:rubrerythrin
MDENYDDDQDIRESIERISQNYGHTMRRLSLSEWQDRIKKQYPYLDFDVAECECGCGWSRLLEPLFAYIDCWNREESKGEHENRITIEQVKEKFGGLRFYFTGGDDRFAGMVDMAELLSVHTCQVCGTMGDNKYTMLRCPQCSAKEADACNNWYRSSIDGE